MKLLYVTTNFHSLTLTFVTREVDALRRSGLDVELLSLRRKAPYESTSPACDLTGCLYLYPASKPRVLASTLKLLLERPSRVMKAFRLAMRSRLDSPRTRLKLLYQAMATTTVAQDVEALGITHIHAHLASPPGNISMFLSALTGIPFSFTGHAADIYRVPECMDTKLQEARGAVCISEYNLSHYHSVVPSPPHTPIIHCGVHPEDYQYSPREAGGTPLRILAVGRAAEKKGYPHLLEALAILDEKGIAWEGHIVGGGPLLESLKARAADLKLDRLTLCGAMQQKDIKPLLDAADVFVLPCIEARDGDIDGIPVSLMEAMMAGCPVVSTRVSGIPELVVHNETGLLADPGDPAMLADALIRIAEEPELVARLSRAGRDFVTSEFNLETESSKLADVFRSYHQQSPGNTP